jgi:hypothetical protein
MGGGQRLHCSESSTNLLPLISSPAFLAPAVPSVPASSRLIENRDFQKEWSQKHPALAHADPLVPMYHCFQVLLAPRDPQVLPTP